MAKFIEDQSENQWQLEVLFKKSFDRTKDRFLSYIIGFFIFCGATTIAIILSLVIGGGAIFLSTLTHNIILTGIISTLFVLVFLLLFFYLTAWWGLAVVQIMIQNNPTDAVSTFKTVRPLVWRYLSTQAIIGIFLLGLLPFIILSLGIVGFLWYFWSVFVVFLFLEKEKKGLESLWASREMYNQRFWAITGRLALVGIIIYFFEGIFQGLSFTNHLNSLRIISTIISCISAPFVISFNYELYKNLSHTEVQVKKPTIWIMLSVIGGIISLVTLVAFTYFAATNVPNMLKENKYNQYNNKKQFRYNTVPSNSSSI